MTTIEIIAMTIGIVNIAAIAYNIFVTRELWSCTTRYLKHIESHAEHINQRISVTQLMNADLLLKDAIREERFEDAKSLKCIIAVIEKDLRRMKDEPDGIDEQVKEVLRDFFKRVEREMTGGMYE